MTQQIFVVRQATFTINGNEKTFTSEIVVGAYKTFEAARERMQRKADKYEGDHYMAIFKREVDDTNFISLVTGGFGAAFSVTQTTLFDE